MLSRSDPLVLGLDGGGTKSLLAMATRQGTLKTLLRGPGVNPLDGSDWRNALSDTLAHAAGCPIVAASVGLPAYGEHGTLNAQQNAAVAESLSCPASVHNDVQLAYDGAFLDAPGVLVLSGTGSMVWAQDGTLSGVPPVRIGGWGHGFGDEGSAYWIGLQAVTLAAHALDGRLDAPDFARAILELIGIRAGADAAIGLTEWFYDLRHPRPTIAAIARGIDALAQAGDPTALRIFEAAADELAAHVEAARKRNPLSGTDWSYAGGSFASPVLKAAMSKRLGQPRTPRLPPIGGALWRAARLAAWTIDAAWIETLAASLAGIDRISSDLPTAHER